MRIVGGTARGKRLRVPKSRRVRPTTDRVREAVFQILGDLTDVAVVDAFAGTGALGAEAWSRGAKFVYFFDADRHAIEIVRDNTTQLRMTDDCSVRQQDFFRGQKTIAREIQLWFVDPPYHRGIAQDAIHAIAQHPFAVDDGLVVVEQDRRESLEMPRGLECEDRREYGDTQIHFLRRVPAGARD